MRARVTASALNLREPFERGEVIGVLPRGTIVEVGDGFGWVEVETVDGRKGWVFDQYLEGIEEAEEPEKPAAKVVPFPWMQFARKEMGVREYAGQADNPRIVEYLKSTNLGYPENANDETPWCSAFVNWCLMMAGIADRTNSAWARSWLKWGKATDEPVEGCIVVFSRGANAGHVAFFLDEDEDSVQVLGGNQGDAVNVAWYPKDRVLDYRVPS
ncbi:MAG: SH3 domain-containing C40 family peptidase [Thermodesulfobacteriota bacterium]